MSIVLWILGILFGGLLYLVVGVAISMLSISVWQDGDENWVSFLLFPLNTLLEDVGNGRTLVGLADEVNELGAYIIYGIGGALFWPLKLVWNIPVIVVGVLLISGYFIYTSIRGLFRNRAAQQRQANSIKPTAGDSIETLNAKLERAMKKRDHWQDEVEALLARIDDIGIQAAAATEVHQAGE